MEINEQMDVEQLRQRMGDATTAEAEQMRNLLVLKGWETTDRIHERDWLSLLDQAAKAMRFRMRKQAWEIWTRVERPDLLEYRGNVKGVDCELWWDNQVGVEPGWCVRINAGVRHREQDVPVKGRKDSKLSTLHRNVCAALR